MANEENGGAVAEKLVSVKIDPEVYRLVKAVAGYKGMNVSEYLTEIVRPVVVRDWERINRDVDRKKAEEKDG